MEFNNLDQFFSILITIVVTLNGISIPLSYNIIAENLKPYLDKNITLKFRNEKAFKCNIITSIGCLIIFLIPLIVDFKTIAIIDGDKSINKGITVLYIVLSCLALTGFLISFIEFSLLIYNYASNTEEKVFELLKEDIDNFLNN